MATFEPRIYRVVYTSMIQNLGACTNYAKIYLLRLNNKSPFRKTNGGIRGVLELWFQEIEGNNITLQIQKKHSSHKKKNLKDLVEFFCDLDNINYLKNYEEIG